MRNSARLFRVVQEIMMSDWDPLHVNGNELCKNEYDSYARSICRLLESGGDETKIAARLLWFKRHAMGLSVVDEDVDRAVARKAMNAAAHLPRRG